MKHKQSLWSDVSVLIVAVLAVMVFLRENIQFWALVMAFAVWSVLSVYRYLIPYFKDRRASFEAKRVQAHYEKQAQQQKMDWDIDISDPLSLVLLRHANYRISAYLQAIYPDATWSWCDKAPETLVGKGGTGRIKLNGVPDFNYAEVTFDQEANIGCQLLHLVPLGSQKENDEQKSEQTETKPTAEVNPQVWYEQKGKKVLTGLIADLNSRGHSSLTIEEDGNIVITQGDRSIKRAVFDSLPDKVVWPRLAKVIEGSGIATEVTEKGLILSW